MDDYQIEFGEYGESLSLFVWICWIGYLGSQEIIVIGAGLAGLTVAISLAQAGHKVVVLESAAEITYIGAGKEPYCSFYP